MSVPVALDALHAAVDERGPNAYVLTVSDDARAHVVHAPVRWRDDVVVAEVGRRSVANVTARPSVSLLFPVRGPDDYSLIVDGTARVETDGGTSRLVVAPVKAVLHRAPRAPAASDAACGADCVPLRDPTAR